MRRRDFLAGLGGAIGLPHAAGGQSNTIPVIGFLSLASPESWEPYVAALRRGLGEVGYVEGRNVVIEYRWARGQPGRLKELATELVRARVAVIAAVGGGVPEAKAATDEIPIVFTAAADPVGMGHVASLSRPGGNATGVYFFNYEMAAKRLEILREVVPRASSIGLLVNPASNNSYALQLRDAESAVGRLGMRLHVARASAVSELAAAFEGLVRARVDALMVGSEILFNDERSRVVALAAQHAIPAIYEWREFVADGGLISYGSSITAAYRQVGLYLGRILKGDRPADLPVQSPTVFELALNLKTARALQLEIPSALVNRADEVIE